MESEESDPPKVKKPKELVENEELRKGEVRKNKSIKCPICDKEFTTKNVLTTHLVTHFRGKQSKKCEEKEAKMMKKNTCPICEKEFPGKNSLASHVINHIGRGTRKAILQEEKDAQTNKCPICDKEFAKINILCTHLLSHCRSFDETEKEGQKAKKCRKCPLCDRSFARQTTLAIHISSHFENNHHEEKSQIGEEIHKKRTETEKETTNCNSENTKDKTKKKSKGDKSKASFSCCYCKKTFKSSESLYKHLRQNSSGSKRFCKGCRKGFSRKCMWTSHVKTNKLETPQACKTCGELFSLKCYLDEHALIHSDPDPNYKQAKFILNKNYGRDKCVDPDGYLYFRKNGSGDKTYWICEKNLSGCKARIHTTGSNIVYTLREHNHEVDIGRAEGLYVLKKIRDRAESEKQTDREIVESEIKDLSDEVKSHLPMADHLRRIVRKIQKEKGVTIVKPPKPEPSKPEVNMKKLVEEKIQERIVEDKEVNAHIQNFTPFSVTYMTSGSGRPKLLDPDGHLYVKTQLSGEEVTWSCEQHAFCKARARTLRGELIEINAVHSHPSDIGRKLVLDAVKRMKHGALLTDKNVEQIIQSEIETYAKQFLSLLPDRKVLQETLEAIRSKRHQAKVDTQLSEAETEPIPARFYQGLLGNLKLIDPDGYTYQPKSHPSRTKKYWRCSTKGCNGKAHTLNDKIVNILGTHAHPPDADTKADVFEFIRKLKARALASDGPLHAIIKSELDQAPRELIPRLPSVERLYRAMGRTRQAGALRASESQVLSSPSNSAFNPPQHTAPNPNPSSSSQENQPPLIEYDQENAQIILSQDLLSDTLDNETIVYIVEQNSTNDITVTQNPDMALGTEGMSLVEPTSVEYTVTDPAPGSVPARYISNETLNPYLVDPCGYLYVYTKLKKGMTHFRCEMLGKCEAKATACGMSIVNLTSDHTHSSDLPRVAMLESLAHMRSRALRSREPLDDIINSEMSNLSPEARAHLPSTAEISEALQSFRTSADNKMAPPRKKPRMDNEYFESIDPGSIVLNVTGPPEEPDDEEAQNMSQQLRDMLPVAGKFLVSLNYQPKLLDPVGFTYFAKSERGKKKYWKCDRCQVRVHTVQNNIVSLNGDHNHRPESTRSVVLDVLSGIKEKALESKVPLEEVVSGELELLDSATVAMLPAKQKIIKTVRQGVARMKRRCKALEEEVEEHDLVVRDVTLPVMLVSGSTGRKKLADPDGYLYHQIQAEGGGEDQWFCEQRRSCRARLYTDGGSTIIKLIGYHTHAANVGRCEALRGFDRMKARALRDREENIEDIVASEISEMTAEGVAWLASQEMLVKRLSLMRERGDGEEEEQEQRAHSDRYYGNESGIDNEIGGEPRVVHTSLVLPDHDYDGRTEMVDHQSGIRQETQSHNYNGKTCGEASIHGIAAIDDHQQNRGTEAAQSLSYEKGREVESGQTKRDDGTVCNDETVEAVNFLQSSDVS